MTEHVVFNQLLFVGRLPRAMQDTAHSRFGACWDLHPAEFYQIRQPGTGVMIPVPRWQQAYARDYRYSGNVNSALPVPPILSPFLAWSRERIDPRLNGLLLNWYDAAYAHRIGAHRDSIDGLLKGAPIVTISLGATRVFRLWPAKAKGFVDFEASHGVVFVLPWQSNTHLKHGVPHQVSDQGRRISITLRSFED
jgi:alkylated DNA repair dioxygenase AlkB